MFDRLFNFLYRQIINWEKRAGDKSAVYYFLLQVLLVGVVNLLIKYLEDVPVFEMIYLRTIFVFLLNFSIMTEYGVDPYPEDERKMRFLFLRGFFNFLSTIFYIFSLKSLSVTRSTSLFYTFSIWIGFVAYILIKDKFTRYEFFSCIFAIVGVIFVIRPSVIFEEEINLSVSNEQTILAIIFGLLAAICFTVYYFLVKRTKIQINVLIYNQIYNLANMAICPIGVFYEGFRWISWEEAGWIFLMGFLHYASQLCFNRGMQTDKTTRKSFYLGYLQIILSLLVDLALGIEVLFTTLIGGGLVLVSSLFLVIKTKK